MNRLVSPVPIRVAASALLGGLLLVSCATASQNSAAPQDSAMENVQPAAPSRDEAMPAAGEADSEAAPAAESTVGNNVSPTDVPRSQPQLAKKAELTLIVDSVDDSIDQVTAIVREHQGDLLGLQDQTPPNEYYRHTASLQLRVPQAQLDATLAALADLGTVQQQSITAEDVSNQLVDHQARLRNLRKTEEMLLEIMERSGEMSEVLQVSQQVSNVRSSIEQIDAQLKDLQNRVAYSTISMRIEESIANAPPQRTAGTQLTETWESATRSIGDFTVDLMQLGIWLLVYSPYWLPLAGAGWLSYAYLKRSQSAVTPNSSEE